MDTQQFFGEARSLLADPSDAAFEQLCQMVEQWPDAQEQTDVLVPYLHGALQSWPCEHRRVPDAWLHNFLDIDRPEHYALATLLIVDRGHIAQLADQLPHSPHTATLEGLIIDDAGLTWRDLQNVVPLLSGIKYLSLSGNALHDHGTANLLKHLDLSQLKHLDLSRNRLTAASCLHIAEAYTLDLHYLDLCHNNIHESGFTTLAMAHGLRHIQELYLRHNPGGPYALDALSHAQWPHLTHLDINGICLGAEGAQSFANINHWQSLRHLYIEQNQLTDAGCHHLAKCTLPLVELNLHNNHIGPQGIETLREAGLFAHIEKLFLGSNHIQGEGLVSMVASTPALKQLHLDKNQIDDQALIDFVQLSDLPQFEILVTWGNDHSPEVLKILDHLDNERLKTINFNRNTLGAKCTEKLKSCNLPNLDELFLYNVDMGDKGCKHLAKCTHLTGVKKLQLGSNNISATGIKHLKNATHFQSVERLEIAENHFGDEGCQHLAQTPHWQNVTFLKLWGCSIEADGARAIAQSPHFEKVEHLNFNRNNIQPEGVTALAQSEHLHQLKDLYLYMTRFDEDAARAFAHSETLRQLEDIELSESGINASVMAQLASHPDCLQNISRIKLDGNWFYDDGVEHLTQNLHWPNLRTLVIWDNGIRPRGAEMLANWPSLRRTTLINLNRNHLGTDGINHLVHSPYLGALQELFLNNNYIYDEGFNILFHSDIFPQLKAINFSRNSLSESAFITLCTDPRAAALQTLWYSDNTLTLRALRALADSSTLTGLYKLEIQDNQLEDAAADIISQSPSLLNLRVLDLNNNNLTSDGIESLTQSPYLTNLETLHLNNNQLDDHAAQLLANTPNLCTLHELEIEDNNITETGWRALHQSPYLHKTIRDGFANLT